MAIYCIIYEILIKLRQAHIFFVSVTLRLSALGKTRTIANVVLPNSAGRYPELVETVCISFLNAQIF